MQANTTNWRVLLAVMLLLVSVGSLSAQSEAVEVPAAIIENDEGGPVVIRGDVAYTHPFFTAGVAEPMVILEDQAGFVDRNEFFLFPAESQVLGQITSDFFTSPFSYSLALPIEPQGSLRDVDNNDTEDTGVMVFAIAYWTNTFGDPFLEERDMYGGGWSTAYSSANVSPHFETLREYVGGHIIIYAPDDQQSFPAGFGEDGRLFTEDDPIVRVPQGYTIVNMDTDPFTFDRSREYHMDLIEGEASEVTDFSNLSFTEAFDEMIEMFRKEYAFTEYKGIDWDQRIEEFRPRFEEAEANSDVEAYRLALRDLVFTIPDGHVTGPVNSLGHLFTLETGGGVGFAIRQLDDGRVIVHFLTPDGPADQAGIETGAEIIAVDGVPIEDALSVIQPWSGPFSTDHVLRLQQLRYVTRAPIGTSVELTYRNPEDEEENTVTVVAAIDQLSWSFSSFNVGKTGFELPLTYEILPSGYAYVKIYSFFDNARLTIDLWERMMRTLNDAGVSGLIIDMRQNGGGSGFLADQMAAYFFDEPHVLGNTGYYDEDLDDFYFDARGEDRFYLPSEDLRYYGDVAVLVGPNCNSACEFFSYVMTIEDRAAIVGQYPTAGLGGSVNQYYMPAGEVLQFTIGRAVNADGEIHIEGIGVIPTVQVPVNEETLFAQGDVILEAAIEYLDAKLGYTAVDGGVLTVGDSVTGKINAGERVQYTFTFPANQFTSVILRGESGDIDTYLRIYDVYNNLLIDNDDWDGTDSGLEALEVGAMSLDTIIEVGTFNDAGTGEYRLEIVDVTDQLDDELIVEPPVEVTEEAEATAEAEVTAEPEATAEVTPEAEATEESDSE